MISHFQLKPLYKNSQLPGWNLSFFYKGQNIKAVYHKDGKIEYNDSLHATEEDQSNLEAQIHELMLYHIYD
ncbi:YheE family protein [Sutcliffiella deserti]|uniref:YheE family protein n=1 Tax=Sutcliffiella deserti TaxID=2875501 RepID=UPI001CBAAA1F|nr:YheE family protein [Sutcliffiella deserti]